MGRRATGRPIKQRGKWRIRWVDEHGMRKSAVFEGYNDALSALRKREHEVEEIRRGERRARPSDRRFAELCDLWLEKRAPKKRSEKDDVSIIRRHLRPALGNHILHALSVNPDPIEDFTDELLERVKEKTARNILTLLGSMMRLAAEREWILKVPKIAKPKIRLFDQDYRYLRSDEEIARFLGAADTEGDRVFAMYATALYTGLRAGELAALTWADIDFDRRLISVQRSFEGPTKSKDLRYVPILDPLLPVLRARRVSCASKIVFTNERGTMHADSSARIFQDVLHRVLERAGFEEEERDGQRRRYITFHGLRHTFASHWMMRGGDLFKLQKILGHKSVQMTQRYAHLAPTAFATDYARLGSAPPTVVGQLIPLLKSG